MSGTDTTATGAVPGMTANQRRAALIVLLAVVFVFAARPTTLQLEDDGPNASCGFTTFVLGADEPAVTQACRNTFRGRAAAALILLGGMVLLASEFAPRRGVADGEPEGPPDHRPGEDPSFLGGLRHASVDPSFRIFAGTGLALLMVLGVVLRPIEIRASVLGEKRTAGCGLGDHLFGTDDASITAACRDAYAARAGGGLLVLLGLGAVVAMMVWIVQYYRGAALGTVWHRAGVPTRLLARTGGACALLATVALFAAAQGAPPATADGADLASAPAGPPSDAPVAADIAPQPTFPPTTASISAATPARRPIGAPPSASPLPPSPPVGTTSTTSVTPAPEPLTVRDASWYTVSPNPLDTVTVPEGSLPVGATGGEDDVHAFFRLRGTASMLTLVPSQELGTQRLEEQARVAVCPVTTADWEQTTGGSFADQPPFDDSACVAAVRGDDGTWTIDFSGFEDRGGNQGFALVPIIDAEAQTFRLTLVPTREHAGP